MMYQQRLIIVIATLLALSCQPCRSQRPRTLATGNGDYEVSTSTSQSSMMSKSKSSSGKTSKSHSMKYLRAKRSKRKVASRGSKITQSRYSNTSKGSKRTSSDDGDVDDVDDVDEIVDQEEIDNGGEEVVDDNEDEDIDIEEEEEIDEEPKVDEEDGDIVEQLDDDDEDEQIDGDGDDEQIDGDGDDEQIDGDAEDLDDNEDQDEDLGDLTDEGRVFEGPDYQEMTKSFVKEIDNIVNNEIEDVDDYYYENVAVHLAGDVVWEMDEDRLRVRWEGIDNVLGFFRILAEEQQSSSFELSNIKVTPTPTGSRTLVFADYSYEVQDLDGDIEETQGRAQIQYNIVDLIDYVYMIQTRTNDNDNGQEP